MSDTPQAYAIDAVEGVEVHLDDSSEDEKLDITVIKEGTELESHQGLTAASLADLSSENFAVSVIEPPQAPPEVDEDYDENTDEG